MPRHEHPRRDSDAQAGELGPADHLLERHPGDALADHRLELAPVPGLIEQQCRLVLGEDAAGGPQPLHQVGHRWGHRQIMVARCGRARPLADRSPGRHHGRTMSRTSRLLVIAVAWTLPVAWILGALLSGPSDGTLVSPATGLSPDSRWHESVTVVHAYGATPLRAGDEVLAVDGHSPGAYLAGAVTEDRAVGDSVEYQVRRATTDLDIQITIDVQLTRYPVLAAAQDNVSTLVLAGLLLFAASLVFWRRPKEAASRAFLATAALVPAVVTSSPFGLGAIDLAGSRGLWPHVAGEVAAAAAFGCALFAALTLTGSRPLRTGWAVAAAVAVPLLGYAAWALLVAGRRADEPGQVQGFATIAGPALVATAVAVPVALIATFLRSTERSDRLAARLVLLALVGGAGLRVLLGDIPEQLTGEPLVPWGVLTVVVAVPVLACIVVALLQHRVDEVEPTVRRALLQASVVALVGGLFFIGVGAVDLASDRSVESMLAGGVIAVLVLPLALGVQRGVRHLLYGDRDLPRRVVSDLRRLDPTTAPEDALAETLTLLARRLRLSYAAVEVFGSDRHEPLQTAIGRPRGTPVTVDLVGRWLHAGPAAAGGGPEPRPIRPGGPAPPRGRRRAGRRPGAGRVDERRAAAVSAAPHHRSRRGASPASP